jgi:hypothetical protein
MTNHFSIEKLDLNQLGLPDLLWKQQVESFCVLNQRRRVEVFQNHNASRMDWIHLLAAVRDDVNALLYLLRKNPGLCLTQVGPNGKAVSAGDIECHYSTVVRINPT